MRVDVLRGVRNILRGVCNNDTVIMGMMMKKMVMLKTMMKKLMFIDHLFFTCIVTLNTHNKCLM